MATIALLALFSQTVGARDQISTAGNSPTQSFHSAPNLHPPAVTFTADSDHSSGDIFATPYGSSQGGPLILDRRGQLVWFHPNTQGVALDFQLQRYHGKPVLTWWQGGFDFDHGTIYGLGEDVIANDHYKTVAVLHGAEGHQIDLHEFQITPQGTALVDAYIPVHMDLTRYGGTSDGTALDCMIQELNIKTGRLLWQWHSLSHVPLTASNLSAPQSPSQYWDYFHLNSIQQLPDGNLLVSARNTWSFYEISRSTGRVLWTLGGKRSDFKIGAGANFEWQHDARMHPGGILSLFDDASFPQKEPQSSAKLLRVNTKTMTVQLYRRYTHSPPLLANLEGNTQVLPNNDVFVYWGGDPQFSEYAPGGRQIFNGSFPQGVASYRAFRFRWTGHPLTPPAVASATGQNGTLTVYASWNGATGVAGWRVLGGSHRGALHPLGKTAPRTGFETAIKVHHRPSYVEVQALDGHGRVLGSSAAQAVGQQ
jgi:hypothetical protein